MSSLWFSVVISVTPVLNFGIEFFQLHNFPSKLKFCLKRMGYVQFQNELVFFLGQSKTKKIIWSSRYLLIFYAMNLPLRPAWECFFFQVAPELKWVWHLCSRYCREHLCAASKSEILLASGVCYILLHAYSCTVCWYAKGRGVGSNRGVPSLQEYVTWCFLGHFHQISSGKFWLSIYLLEELIHKISQAGTHTSFGIHLSASFMHTKAHQYRLNYVDGIAVQCIFSQAHRTKEIKIGL